MDYSTRSYRSADCCTSILWASALVLYTLAVATRARMSVRDCNCERLLTEYSLPYGANISVQLEDEGLEEACADRMRWAAAVWNQTLGDTAVPLPQLETTLEQKREFKNRDNAAIRIEKKEKGRLTKPQRFGLDPELSKSYKFYGYIDNYDEDPPDREAYVSFFIEDDVTKSKRGTFVEVGAGNGQKHSNSLFFEESLGWGGLLIEGEQGMAKELLSNYSKRASRTKPIQAVICEPRLDTEEVRFTGTGEGAGVEKYMLRAHLMKQESKWGDGWRNHRRTSTCTTLENILDREGIGSVDLMTINISGAEKAAIEGLNVEKVQIRVVMISMPNEHGGIERETRVLLMERGFCFSHRTGRNEFWVADHILRRVHCAWSGLQKDP